MVELQAWLWLPAVLYLVSSGIGLLAERLAGMSLPSALLAPVGAAVLVVLVIPVYRLGAEVDVAVPVVIAAALAGFALARRELPGRLNPGAAGLAAIGAYALYLAPVALSGHWSWAGYNFVNDTAASFIFADALATRGMTLPAAIDSTTAVIAATPIRQGYPLGAHALLATLEPLSGASIPAIYHPLIAVAAALGAMSLTQLGHRAGLSARAAIVAAVLAVGANLIYRYALQGGIKEVLAISLLATTTAVAAEAVESGLRARAVALAGVCAFSIVAVFSAAAAAYVLALGVLVLIAALLSPRRPRPRHLVRVAAAAIAVVVLVSLPTLAEIVQFGADARQAFASEGGESTAYMGQLLRPLPVEQAAGVWLARDYRVAPAAGDELANSLLIAAVVAALVAGVVVEVRRRRLAGLLLLGATASTAALGAPGVSPYIDAKLLAILSTAVVFVAAIGALTLIAQRRPAWRVAGLAVLLAMVAGVGYSDALAYRQVQLAPIDRMEAMEDAAAHAGGGGLWLVNEWEEFAKYFMRSIRVNAAFESDSPKPVLLRKPAPIFGRYYDLDRERLDYVTQFAGIIKRRSPDSSRPPASYEMVYENEYYEVWRRRAGVEVVEHLPLQRTHRAVDEPRCEEVRRLARAVGRGERLVAVSPPRVSLLETASATRTPGWVRDRAIPGTVIPTSPGHARGRASVPEPGRYTAWVRGTFGRAVSAHVDDRTVGAVKQVNTPGQWLEAGTVELRRGAHRLKLRRPRPSLAPGDGYIGTIGPLALERIGDARMVSVPAHRAERLCGRRWDWIELVRQYRS